MTKVEIAAQVASEHELTKVKAGEIVDAVFGAVVASLKAGKEVKVAGFGKFEAVAVPTRQGRNPRTGESITISARTNVKFKPSTALKATVNE